MAETDPPGCQARLPRLGNRAWLVGHGMAGYGMEIEPGVTWYGELYGRAWYGNGAHFHRDEGT